MSHHKRFKNESQDARRHDQHRITHPDEPNNKHSGELESNRKNKKGKA